MDEYVSMDERLGTEEGEEEVTLEVLNIRVESMVESLNTFFNVITKDFATKVLLLEDREKTRDRVVSESFRVIQLALNSLAVKTELLLQEVSNLTNTPVEEYLKECKEREEEILKLQEEQIQEFLKKTKKEEPVKHSPPLVAEEEFFINE